MAGASKTGPQTNVQIYKCARNLKLINHVFPAHFAIAQPVIALYQGVLLRIKHSALFRYLQLSIIYGVETVYIFDGILRVSRFK